MLQAHRQVVLPHESAEISSDELLYASKTKLSGYPSTPRTPQTGERSES